MPKMDEGGKLEGRRLGIFRENGIRLVVLSPQVHGDLVEAELGKK